ncbi:hypothetical protein C8R43DRAFT_1138698 [Mycena crocata]|nr:hypothetical protein C8R43DRAFT_1138698 [Mycena crocata]
MTHTIIKTAVIKRTTDQAIPAPEMSAVNIFDPANPARAALIPDFSDTHIACIETDHTIANFIPPLNRDAILDWWKERAAEAARGSVVIFMAFAKEADGQGALQATFFWFGRWQKQGRFAPSLKNCLFRPSFVVVGLQEA